MEYKLIEAVQMHPCLYDKSSVAYRNRLAKEKAWNYVAGAIGCSVEQCQSRWRSLRDRFVKDESGRKAPSGSAANDMVSSGWKYYEALAFLQRHVSPRKTFDNATFGTTIDREKCTPQPEHSINVYESQPLFEYCENEEPVFEQTQQTGLTTVVHQSPPTSLVDFQPEKEPIVTTSRALNRKKDEERLATMWSRKRLAKKIRSCSTTS
ncbi:PREDICTED: uncharacterized protein LOC108360618 [Rhagoletis zephyria]|uniref:uncharacterized protein LOC108360618 n=1 Tax=Rhagoletis zephyria TaxID=28612 RepID=UPI00081173E1|nr:PREDICTED: uncharacterized protein LOC108360618 [Rhagoletis zephyria]